MNNPKIDMSLVWSPFRDDEFILVGNSVFFYRITSFDGSMSKNRIDSNLFLSDNSYAKLIGSINNYPNPKLVGWCPGVDIGYYTIALHEINQNQIRLLSLTSFNSIDSSNLADNELTILEMEHPRKSYQLKWNPTKCNYLGLACEKLNDLNTIYIWDAFLSTKPVYQLDEFETCCSLSWHPESPDILFAGSTFQYISLFDLRVGKKPVESVNTEFIKGFTIDSKNSIRAASYNGNTIALWDLRKFQEQKKPIGFMEEPKPIKKLQFCPIKADRLAVLSENSTQVNVYRLEERNENIYRETVHYLKYPKNSAIINSFSWHSKDFNRLMATFNTFNLLMDLTVADYCAIDFSINDNLNICMNDKVSNISFVHNENELDIGEKMKRRALKSYGVQDFRANIDLISNDRNENDLKYLWHWFDLSKKTFDKSFPFLEKYIGIKTLLALPQSNSNSVESNFHNQNLNEIIKNYIFKMCGWDDTKELVSRLESQKEYERAACVCAFNQDLKKAIELLTNASKSSNLNEYLALSLALNCINKSSSTFDSKDSSRILTKLTNPYLKALFSYQIDPENFDYQIFNDVNILIPDRVCMALNIFKTDQLAPYINKLASDCTKQGNLYGILLTGLNSECIELFQTYIHRTSDVQTPAVAIIHSSCVKTMSSKYVNGWIESYRELLDSWMLWEQRSQYDISRSKIVEPKIHIRCGYCAENISSKRKPRNTHETYGANIGMTCQACQKPSLRCSVCSLYMSIDPPRSALAGEKDKMFHWFVLCQKCSHGGHLGHLINWFKVNPECPAMSCQCHCSISEGILE